MLKNKLSAAHEQELDQIEFILNMENKNSRLNSKLNEALGLDSLFSSMKQSGYSRSGSNIENQYKNISESNSIYMQALEARKSYILTGNEKFQKTYETLMANYNIINGKNPGNLIKDLEADCDEQFMKNNKNAVEFVKNFKI